MDKELLKKFLRDQCTHEEYRKVITWFNTHGEEKLLELIEKDWHHWEGDITDDTDRLQTLLRKTHSRILQDQQYPLEKGKYSKPDIFPYKPYSYHKYSMVAVASFLLVAVVLFVFQYSNLSDIDSPPEQKSKYVPAGQKAIIYLSDGTKVMLNADSELIFPEKFSQTSRQVHLSGEGFFEVVEDPSRPFSVVSGQLTTVALGTSFNIKAYEDEDDIEVALANGKVEVRDSSDGMTPVVLAPGELINLNTVTLASRKENFLPEEKLGWTENVLYFKAAEAKEVFAALERWYGVKFRFNKALEEGWQYSGKFKAKSLETVLEGIAYVKEFSFAFKEGKQVEIVFK